MPTHPIAQDTTNVTVNMLRAQSELIGRFAFQNGESRGAMIRHLILRGLEVENPDIAALWSDCRRSRFIIKSVTLFAGLLAVWQAMQPANDLDMRRAPARVRIVRVSGRRES